MAKLSGIKVGEPITEYLGPITGRNHNINGTAPAPTVTILVTGSGSVTLQETQVSVIRGNSGTNTFTNDRLPDPTTWVDLTTVDATAGETTVVVTADDNYAAIRAIVAVEGEGKVVIQSNWV